MIYWKPTTMLVQNSVAIVTGGGRGIGRAIVESLLVHQAKRVIIAELNETLGSKAVEELNAAHGPGKCHFVRCDVSNQEQLRQAFKKAMELDGRVDIVCNNAGIVNECDPHLVIDVNVKGVINGSLLALEFMSKEKGANGGVVINLASVAGLSSFASIPSYTASKHAVVGWTGSMGSDMHLKRHNIRFNCLCPSFVATDMSREMLHPDSRSSLLTNSEKEMFKNGPKVPMQAVTDLFVQLIEDPKAFNGIVCTINPPNVVEYLDKSMK